MEKPFDDSDYRPDTLRVTVSTNKGGVYSEGTVDRDERGDFIYTDEDGDRLTMHDLLVAAAKFARIT